MLLSPKLLSHKKRLCNIFGAKILETDEKSKKTEENYFWENTCTTNRKETKMSELGPEPVSVKSYVFSIPFLTCEYHEEQDK